MRKEQNWNRGIHEHPQLLCFGGKKQLSDHGYNYFEMSNCLCGETGDGRSPCAIKLVDPSLGILRSASFRVTYSVRWTEDWHRTLELQRELYGETPAVLRPFYDRATSVNYVYDGDIEVILFPVADTY